MAKLAIKKDLTGVALYLFIQNSSVSTGAGLTGLVFNSASLVAYYVRPLAAATAITLATQTVTGAFSSGGFVEVDATNMPGVYRFDVPNAAIATGVNSVVVMLKGATNMAPVVLEIDLVAYDPQSATNLGLSQIDAAVSSRMATYTQPTGFLAATFPATVGSPTNITAATGIVLSGVTHTGAVIPTVTTTTNLTTNNDKTGYGLSAAAVQAVWDALTSALTTVGSVGKKLADWVIGTSQTGDSFVRLGAPAGVSVSADIAALPTAAGNADTLLDRDMSTGTDSGSATVRTVRQALRFLRNKWSISGGTLTVTKENDVTASWTAAVTTAAGNPVDSVDPASV